MKQLATLALLTLLFIFGGCSEEKTEPESGNRDHFLRQPMDTMYDAKAVQERMNRETKEKEEQAGQIAGQ